MINDINKYIDFLVKNKISEHQFLILWLVHTKDQANINRYESSLGKFSTTEVMDLVKRNWLDDYGRATNICDMVVTEKFTKVVVIDEEDSYEELRKAYPGWLEIKGVAVPAITGDPRKISLEYFKCHRGDRAKHEEIIGIVRRWFAGKTLAQEKIENFVLNKRWELLKEKLTATSSDTFKRI
jgi:hypothetical protein